MKIKVFVVISILSISLNAQADTFSLLDWLDSMQTASGPGKGDDPQAASGPGKGDDPQAASGPGKGNDPI